MHAAFIEDPGRMHVCHSCDNPPCVNPRHLWLGNDADNARDKEKKGRGNQAKGEDQGHSKLKAEDVLIIRSLVSDGMMQKDLAERFNVSRHTVTMIVHRRTWKHI
jgi:ribosome-binding protein aMBF1 (putative translation factor)